MDVEQGASAGATAGVLAILVVYGRHFKRAAAWSTLLATLRAGRLQGRRYPGLQLCQVLVYDNSPEAVVPSAALLPGLTYRHDRQNGGTAAAYRAGAELAAALGLPWLLLLDQDTALPADFFPKAFDAWRCAPGRPPAALLPWVRHGDRVVSPARIKQTGSIAPLDPNVTLRPQWRLTGIASGAFLRTAQFAKLGAAPKELWLDYVDHWIFARLNSASVPLALIDCVLEHDLSIVNPQLLSGERLRNILVAESRFVAMLPWLARLIHPWRLLSRAALMAAKRPDHALLIGRHVLGLRPSLFRRSNR